MKKKRPRRTKRLYSKRLQKKEGFSLIELMITIAVVSLALVGTLFANTAMSQAGETTFERAMALQEANQVIESIRQTAATGLFPGNVTAAFPNNTARPNFANLRPNCGVNADPPVACTWPFNFTASNNSNEQVVVTYVNPAANPLDVTVTVVWRERGVRQAQIALRTLITQRT